MMIRNQIVLLHSVPLHTHTRWNLGPRAHRAPSIIAFFSSANGAVKQTPLQLHPCLSLSLSTLASPEPQPSRPSLLLPPWSSPLSSPAPHHCTPSVLTSYSLIHFTLLFPHGPILLAPALFPLFHLRRSPLSVFRRIKQRNVS